MEALDLIVIDKRGLPDQTISLTDPDTGEVVPLTECGRELCARVLGRTKQAIDDHLDYLRTAQHHIGQRVLSLMDDNAEWTIGSRGVKVTAPSPTAGTEGWDAELLDKILSGLVDKNVITQEAKLKAVSQKVETVTHPAGIRALLKRPDVAKAMKRARTKIDPPARRVTVKVTDPGEL